MRPYKAKTKQKIEDIDAATSKALGIEPIPAGAIVDVIGTYSNLKGNYTKVKYKGFVYYTKANLLEKV